MAGRALRAAHPHTEFTTTSVVPAVSFSRASTSAGVRSSSTPSRVSSCRIGVTKRSSYIILLTSLMDSVRLLAHQREDGLLGDDEIPLALERDLDRRLAKEQRVVAAPGLHGNEARFAR